MFILIDGKPVPFTVPHEAFLDGDIEIESINNKAKLVTYEAPHEHFEKACSNKDVRETINQVVELGLDKAFE